MKCWKTSAFPYSVLAVHQQQYSWAKSIPQSVILATGFILWLGPESELCSIRAPLTTCLMDRIHAWIHDRRFSVKRSWAVLRVMLLTWWVKPVFDSSHGERWQRRPSAWLRYRPGVTLVLGKGTQVFQVPVVCSALWHEPSRIHLLLYSEQSWWVNVRWASQPPFRLFIWELGFPGSSVVKNPPAKQETQVWPLGQEYPLEKEMATHSSILVWRIPWTEELGGLHSL